MKYRRAVTIILAAALAFSLITDLLFWLAEKTENMDRLIYGNPITFEIAHIPWFGLPYFIIGITVIANIIYSSAGFHTLRMEKKLTPKENAVCVAYIVVSAGAFILHSITFLFVLSCIIASV